MNSACLPHRGQVGLASGLNLLVGIWLVLSAFALRATGDMRTNDVAFGVIVAVFAALRLLGSYGQSWMSWLNAAVGAWLVVSPWAVTVGTTVGPAHAVVISNVGTGGAILALGVWGALATNTERGGRTHRKPIVSSNL